MTGLRRSYFSADLVNSKRVGAGLQVDLDHAMLIADPHAREQFATRSRL